MVQKQRIEGPFLNQAQIPRVQPVVTIPPNPSQYGVYGANMQRSIYPGANMPMFTDNMGITNPSLMLNQSYAGLQGMPMLGGMYQGFPMYGQSNMGYAMGAQLGLNGMM